MADGADVNAKDEVHGDTALHHAAFRGHKEIAEPLISKGVNVKATNEFA